jgi:hypothetical protein
MKQLFLFTFIIFFIAKMLSAQLLTVFDVDTSNFPTMKAKFYAYDINGNQLANFSVSDILLTENGQPRQILSVTCPNYKQPPAVSSVLVNDVSGSMCEIPSSIDIVQSASIKWVNMLNLGNSDCAITSFSDGNYINQDFTTNKSKLINAINSLSCLNNTDFNVAMISQPAGGILIARTGKHRRIIVFLTDGKPNYEPKTSQIISLAQQNNITIYCIAINNPAPQCMKDFANQTGGRCFENIRTSKEADDCYNQIFLLSENIEPCEIIWQSGIVCKSTEVALNVKLIPNNLISGLNFRSPISTIAKLEFAPSAIKFYNLPMGIKKDTSIIITAINSDFNISNVANSNPQFSLTPTKFHLNKGQSITLNISITPTDSNFDHDEFNFESDICPEIFFVENIYTGKMPTQQTLHLTHPNGGEFFVVGSDTIITWAGVTPEDTVRLEYSTDGGTYWMLITNYATGLSYNWKNIPNTTSNNCLVKVTRNLNGSVNTIPSIKWQKSLGGKGTDRANSIQETSDGGYIFAGSTDSKEGDVTGYHQHTSNPYFNDFWLVKLNHSGSIEWEKCLGGMNDDIAYSVHECKSGGYIVAGSSESSDGDVTCNQPSFPYHKASWIVKSNNSGTIEWKTCLCGSTHSIEETIDGGFIAAGIVESDDTCNGYPYYGVIKLNNAGGIEWHKSYGGGQPDQATSICQTFDGGYIVVGSVGVYYCNFWINKLNKLGAIEWQKNLGGSDVDFANSIKATSDGGYIVAGYTGSNDGDVQGNHGADDSWIIKLNNAGDIQWKKCFGGSLSDYAVSIQETIDGGYIFAGSTYGSIDGDVSGNHGNYDFWVVKLNNSGNLVWQKCLGGSNNDQSTSIQQTTDGGYVVAGFSDSNDGDVTGNHGNWGQYDDKTDCWVVKLSPDAIYQEDISDSVFSIVEPNVTSNEIDMKQVHVGKAKDSVITPFLINSGSYKCRIDSIYIEGIDKDQFSVISWSFPYQIDVGQSKNVEFEFKPTSIGVKSAIVVIIMQSDTIRENITGEGVQIQIQVLNKFIDFGIIEINTIKDSTISLVIKNISNTPIDITNTILLGPDKSQFIINNGGGAFTLATDSSRTMELTFAPVSIGRTSGSIGFEYSGVGSPAIVQLYGQGIGGKVAILDDSAYNGEKTYLKLELGNNIIPKTQSIATGYKVKLSFNPTLLSITDKRAKNTFTELAENVQITSQWDGANKTLGTFEAIAGLGDAESTNLVIEDFKWLDKNNNEINFDVETVNGTFSLLGVCHEGGPRLYIPTGKAEIMMIKPNPASDEINITVNTIEDGETYLILYNSLGTEVSRIKVDSLFTGEKHVFLNMTEYSNGIYFIKYQTPTWSDLKKIIIYR